MRRDVAPSAGKDQAGHIIFRAASGLSVKVARCGEAGCIININGMLQATSIRELCQSVKLKEGSETPGCSTSLAPLDKPVDSADLLATPLTRRRNSQRASHSLVSYRPIVRKSQQNAGTSN